MAQGDEDPFIKMTLEQVSDIKKYFQVMIQAWETADDKVMLGLRQELADFSPQLLAKMLTDRNKNWLPKIEAMLQTPTTELVLVGALHLYGPQSVIELLKAKGYQIKQL